MLDPLAPTQDATSEGGGAPTDSLAKGTIVDGLFRVERELGRGGMGAVYLARDVRLERDVALKLGNVLSASALARIEREAIALAKLQHPNVVVIHQVGKFDGRLYIAMEYVAGGNATQWLKAKPRTTREIVLLFAAAGDGLIAAHAAGFVHRDFKPDNILVGEDGRPRVADFGLVVAAGESTESGEVLKSSPAFGSMTQAGALVGTPAYMAPEQLKGKPTDARADQFALCVSVWEALFNTRPHSGRTPAEITSSIQEAKFEVPNDARPVPRRVVAALRRGMSADPAARWPTLSALLAELRSDPARRRRQWMIGGAVAAVVVAAVVAVLSMRATTATPCTDGPQRIAEVWNPQRSHALETSFEQAKLGASWSAVRTLVENYSTSWVGGYRAACRAARVDRSESEALLDRRMLCLNRARSRLDSLLTSFASNRESAADAAGQTTRLPDLAQCADSGAFAQQAPLPHDPVIRAKIEAAATVVDRALAAGELGWDRNEAATAEAALTAARDTGWPPLIADAMRARAAFELDADLRAKQYRAAASAALAAGDDRVAAWSYADGAWSVAHKSKDAEDLLEPARALWERLGKPADLGNRIEGADSERLFAAGDPVAGLAAVKRANELSQKAYPDNPRDRATEHFNVARGLDASGDYDEAAKELDTAIAIATKTQGESHPQVAGYLDLASQIAQRRGKLDDGVKYARRALAINESWYGKTDPRLSFSLNGLGQLLAFAGQLDESRQLLERAIVLDPDEQIANPRYSLGMVEVSSGNPDRAIKLWADELAHVERDGGTENEEHAHIMLALGVAHRDLGHLKESHDYLAHSEKLERTALGPSAPQTINSQIELSYTLVAEHHAADAVTLLEPALAVSDLAAPVAAELHAAFGKALWEAGDHGRAKTEVTKGREAYAALDMTTERDSADAWLKAHH